MVVGVTTAGCVGVPPAEPAGPALGVVAGSSAGRYDCACGGVPNWYPRLGAFVGADGAPHVGSMAGVEDGRSGVVVT
jgi:hypothetical protein